MYHHETTYVLLQATNMVYPIVVYHRVILNLIVLSTNNMLDILLICSLLTKRGKQWEARLQMQPILRRLPFWHFLSNCWS
mmetsp:Transcript_3887/g.6735  ORF Transcript_3887/g.6735 Transcript_3887/m.6735 type:complete len:80 (-) Transcript_3887:250-489(-)